MGVGFGTLSVAGFACWLVLLSAVVLAVGL